MPELVLGGGLATPLIDAQRARKLANVDGAVARQDLDGKPPMGEGGEGLGGVVTGLIVELEPGLGLAFAGQQLLKACSVNSWVGCRRERTSTRHCVFISRSS